MKGNGKDRERKGKEGKREGRERKGKKGKVRKGERKGRKKERKGKGRKEGRRKGKERKMEGKERKGPVMPPSCICRSVIDTLCFLCFQVASATSAAQLVSRVERGTDAVGADPTWRDRSVICEFKQLQD